MSLFRRDQQQKRLFGINSTAELIPARTAGRVGLATVTNDTAMRHSAVWACLRLRADLISTLPVDVFRDMDGRRFEVPKPPIMRNPGGAEVDWCEWMYSSQVDLDRSGNVFGIITETNSLGLPNRIDLQPLSECSILVRNGELYYRIAGKVYDPSKVWHERQFTISGSPVGLSPIAYASLYIGQYLSVAEFAANWFGDGAIPAAQLRNTARTIPPETAAKAKESFKAAVANRDLWVTGNDWEYNMIQAEALDASWIEGQKLNVTDIARFFGCPATEIDGAVSGSSITYANLTQDDLRFLIKHLGPAITRRENKMSARWLPQPRYVKFKTDALLRMDAKTRTEVVKTRIDSRTLTPNEARALEDLPPLTDAQIGEFDKLFGSKNPAPTPDAATRVYLPRHEYREPIYVEAVAGPPIRDPNAG